MKVLAPLTTLLGASSAAPTTAISSGDMRMSLRSNNLMDMSVDDLRRSMDMSRQMSNMRNIYSNTQALGPNQYFQKDSFGNYAYGYSDLNSEKREEGNDQSIKGSYSYIMSNGLKRQVDYIADDQGFHILRDDADSSRIKRSAEPEVISTRMTSVMDSSSLGGNSQDMYRLGQDMSSMNMDQQMYSMDRNMMEQDMISQDMSSMNMDHQMYSMDRKMMDRDMMGRNMLNRDMMGRNMMGLNMMGRDIMGRNMMNRDMTGRNINGLMGRRNIYNINQDSGMMRQQMSSNMSGRDMSSNMMYNNMLTDRDMTSNMMRQGSNMLGRMDSFTTEGMMGQQQRMSQQMEMTPETYTSTRFF